MKTIKFLIFIYLIFILSGMILTGCGLYKTRVSQHQKKDIITIEGLVLNTWVNEGTDALIREIAANTGIYLEVKKLPDNGGGAMLTTKLAANEVPEIIIWHSGGGLSSIYPDKNLVDLSNEAWTNRIENVMKEPYSYNGKLYGAPWVGLGISIGGIFYNKKIFKKNGITEIPKTWDEFLVLCENLKKKGVVPVYASLQETWTNQILHLCSIPYVYDEMPGLVDKIVANKLKLASVPSYVQGLGRAKELKDRGYYNKNYLSALYENAIKALANGDVAMYPMGSWIMDQIKQKYPDKIDDIGAFAMPAPQGAPKATVWIDGGVYISKTAKNLKAAKRWVAAYCDPKNQMVYYNVMKGFPVIKGVKTDGLYPAMAELKKYLDEGKYAINIQNICPLPFGGLDQVIGEVIIKDTPEWGARQLDAILKKEAKTRNLPGWK